LEDHQAQYELSLLMKNKHSPYFTTMYTLKPRDFLEHLLGLILQSS